MQYFNLREGLYINVSQIILVDFISDLIDHAIIICAYKISALNPNCIIIMAKG